MLGSSIYGLIGQAAGQVGNAVWASFLVAMVAALLTALSYASLGSRYPRAGGAAFVTQKVYQRHAVLTMDEALAKDLLEFLFAELLPKDQSNFTLMRPKKRLQALGEHREAGLSDTSRPAVALLYSDMKAGSSDMLSSQGGGT